MRIKRIGAYLIDMFIILIVSNILSGFLPNSDKMSKISNESGTVISNYVEAVKSNSEDIDKYVEELNDFNYELAKVSVSSNLLSVFLYILYFVVFQRYNNGQTIGKSLFKIEIVSKDEEEITIKQMIIRGVILFSVITTLLDALVISIFNQSAYDSTSTFIMLLECCIFLSCAIPVLLNKTGLHEILSKTTVEEVGSKDKEEGKVSKWKKTVEEENRVKNYRVNHTSGKRKE